jgi:polyphosphate kinase 2 (PPK2 family)
MAAPRLSRLKPGRRFASKTEYEKTLDKLQKRLLSIQQAYYHSRRRAVLVFEGWDAAGKGGAIRRLTEHLDPRGVHVWPIGAPTAEEQGRHYMYRFWQRLPAPGTIAIFDRSWYGRVLVERVDKLAPKPAWRRAYREIVEFERLLIDDGVRVAKVFLHITPDEQLKRFAERLEAPEKRWKLTQADIDANLKYDDYARAADDMFARTSWKGAPWKVLHANSKWNARIEALTHICEVLSAGVDLKPPPLDPDFIKAAKRLLAGRGKR